MDEAAPAADPYLGADVYAPARRTLWLGPLILLGGAGVALYGLSGRGSWWLLAIPGGALALFGLLRTLAGCAVLLVERQRARIAREGIPAIGVVISAKQLGTRLGYPVFEMELDVATEDGRKGRMTKKGAVPPQYAGEFAAGSEVPLRVDRDDLSAFAVDWAAF